jgi:PAS domain S-box-containing protein
MSGAKCRSILLVEDEILLAMAEKMTLERYGYEVTIAGSGEKALAAIVATPRIELILMDINLGDGIEGTEAAKRILGVRDIPIVFLSSHTESDIVESTESISSYGYVVKNSGITVLDASIKMAFKLFESYESAKVSSSMLEATLSALPDLLFELGLDGRYYDFHSPRAESPGAEAVPLAGTFIQDAFPREVSDVILSALREAHETGFSAGKQYRIGNNGDSRWFEISASRKGRHPVEPRFIVLSRDITSRKRMAEALADSEKRYRRLFESAKDGILILDAKNGKIMDVNPYLIEMLGFSKERFLEKAIWEIGTFQNIIANQDKFLELQDEEYVRYENLPLETADGETIAVEFVSNVYLVDGRRIIQCNIRNIARRKRAEKVQRASATKYRRLFETAQEGILILDAGTGKIVDVNPFLVGMLGFSKEQFLEKAIWEIGTFQNIVANQDKFLELQDKEYLRYEDMPLATSIGKTIEVEFISHVYLANGHRFIQCLIRNITERKTAEGVITRLLKEKELILKEVHHRIKNDMSAISSLLSLQADSMKNPAAAAALEDAGSRVQSMMVLYRKLYQSENFKTVSVLDFLPSLVDEVLANFPNSASVSVRKDVADFALDAQKLQPLGIIITELLTNIMKYAFAGRAGGSIAISALPAGNRAVFSIEDDGNGMPESIDFGDSTSFGLTLVNILTRQLKGNIRVERRHGTRITLEFER